MERVGTLIDKLKRQFEQNAGKDQLVVTAHLLVAELQKQQSMPTVQGKISVILPAYIPIISSLEGKMNHTPEPENPPGRQPEEVPERKPESAPAPQPEKTPGYPPEEVPEQQPEQVPVNPPEQVPERQPDQKPGMPPEETPKRRPEYVPHTTPEQVPDHRPERVPEPHPEQIPGSYPEQVPERYPETVPEEYPEQVPEEYPAQMPGQTPEVVPSQFYYPKEVLAAYAPKPVEPVPKPQPAQPVKKEENVSWLFNSNVGVPTLEQQDQKVVYELNDIMTGREESLNDKLKEDKMEVAAALHSATVRDLKKAIGINDRYLFINELFRGDENMYERSLKTINSFSIFPEAQYWIQRELKVKLGWDENSDAVLLFNQLVTRRFS